MTTTDATIVPTSFEDVEELMQDEGAVIIEFSSTACPACKNTTPVFDAVAKQHLESSVLFARIHTNLRPKLAERFKIRSIPSVLLCLDGQVIDSIVGRLDHDRLDKRVEWLVKRSRGDGFLARIFGFARPA